MRQKCVIKNASKMRGAPLGGEHLLDDTEDSTERKCGDENAENAEDAADWL